MVPKGHHEIAKACVPILKAKRPFDDFAYFYLGNWFTDLSQAIAPVDYAAAMLGVLRMGRASAPWYAPKAMADDKINQYVEELLGSPPPKGSKMAAYFRDVVYVVGWGEFCRDPRRVTGDEVIIPFEEYDRIFRQRLTQYFPHEHLDRWPVNRSGSSQLGRRVYDYLERDLVYVAELLTRVERDWAKVAATAESGRDPNRHDLLLELGHALHAVEDWFAHSNYVEFAMKMFNPGRFYGTPEEARRFEARLRRERIPRTDAFDEKGNPTPPGPDEWEEDVVTGYFDSIDTRFSLDGVYQHLIEKLRAFPDGGQVINLLDYRGQGITDDAAKAKFRKDKEAEYDKWHDRAMMPQPVRDAHYRFIRLDWDMMDRWKGNGLSFAMENMIKDGEAWKSKVFTMPDGKQIPYSERIGSHTLLAKDAPDKTPGYQEAMSLAKQVGRYISRVMVGDLDPRDVAKAKNDPNKVVVGTWVDWLKLLRYFCGHPEEAQPIGYDGTDQAYWWTGPLAGRNTGTGHMLEYIDKATVDDRAALKARKRLEVEHNSMIPMEVSKYRAKMYGNSLTSWAAPTLKRGETKLFEDTRVNAGTIRVTCKTGAVRVALSMDVMDTRREYTSKDVAADETWSGEFIPLTTSDWHLPQTNRAIVTGLAEESTCEVDMVSWAYFR